MLLALPAQLHVTSETEYIHDVQHKLLIHDILCKRIIKMKLINRSITSHSYPFYYLGQKCLIAYLSRSQMYNALLIIVAMPYRSL